MVRYRFSDFTLSPQRRLLLRQGQEVPLIPRYFDLLLLLIERRREAVHRNEIFDRVWGDVTVSDSALSQAVRTIRRTLDDDSREPRFIRTVSRHGYQFVFAEVIEEDEASDTAASAITPGVPRSVDPTTGPVMEGGLRSSGRVAARGWTAAIAGGAAAGALSGAAGGLILAAAPGSTAPFAIVPVLAFIGGSCGAIGGLGVGAGVGVAESVQSPQRALAVIVGSAAGGGLVGAAVQWLARWALSALVGLDLEIGGGLEGVLIGTGAGLGFAIATLRDADGWLPRWGHRLHAAAIVGLLCGMAGLALTLSGRPLAGGTIHAIADAAEGSRVTLAPLGQLLGETDFGPLTSAIIAFGEAATFGVGVALAMVRRRV